MDTAASSCSFCLMRKQNETNSSVYEYSMFPQPFSLSPSYTQNVLYILVFADFLHRFSLFLPNSYLPGDSTVWIFSIFRSAAAAFTDIKILQTISETTLCKRGWAGKAFEILSPWALTVCDGTLPVAINDRFAVSCFVLSESALFAITANLCLIKKRCTALNLAVYIMEASRRGSFQTFAKDFVASHA